MELFKNRPLLTFCTAYMAVLGVGVALPWDGSLVWILLAVCLTLAFLTALFFRRRSPRHAAFGAVLFLVAAVAVWQSFWLFEGSRQRFDAYADTACEIEAVVERRYDASALTGRFDIRIEAVNGEAVRADARLNCEHASNLQEGYRFRAVVTVCTLSAYGADEGVSEAALIADGYDVICRSESEQTCEILDERAGGWSAWWSSLRRRSVGRIRAGFRCMDDTRATLTEAMLLGDKTDLDPRVQRDFSRTGVAHLLALSGLHVTLLFGTLGVCLERCRIPKRGRAAILMVTAAGYVCLTGCSVSVIRAVLMMSVVGLSHLFRSVSDGRTALGVAGALILLCQPEAVVDAGFWMSFSSTLGLVTAMPLVNRLLHRWEFRASRLSLGKRRVVKCASYVTALLMVGVVAMTFSLWITALAVGKVNVASVWLTVLLSPAAYVLLLGGACLIPFGGTAVGDGIAAVVYRAERWMVELTEAVSADTKPMAVNRTGMIVLCALVAVTMLALLCGKLRRTRWFFLPVAAGWVVLVAWVGLMQSPLAHAQGIQTTYVHTSVQSEALVMSLAGESVLVDLSDGAHSSWNAAAAQARADGSTEWAAVVLTDYHARTSGSLARLLDGEMVRRLWLPYPRDEADEYRMRSCVEKAESRGVPVSFYRDGSDLRLFGRADLRIEVSFIERSVRPVLLLTVDTEQDALTVCGAAVFESALADKAQARVADSEAVIFACTGPLIKQPFACLFSDSVRGVTFADEETFDFCQNPPPAYTVGEGQVRLKG